MRPQPGPAPHHLLDRCGGHRPCTRPSIVNIDVIARVASEEFLKSDLDIPINEGELALYCAIVLDKEELDTHNDIKYQE